MSEEELYNNIVEILSKGDFLQINGKPINLKELNDYINSQQQEIERLNKEIEQYKYSADELNEIERLNNIIKELREYIEEMQIWLVDFEDFGITTKGLLEILDKGE